jgi:uncharacterized membrane protein
MEAYLLDWANLLLRWLHVITAIAWIGSSFYFVFLDNNLVPPRSPDLLEKGVDGAMWAVHGGGFYNPQKYAVAPKKIHTQLHWFYWESYATWLSGFALFLMLYVWNAPSFLVDARLVDWPAWTASGAAIGMLLAFWLVYDGICRQFGFRRHGEAVVGALTFATIAVMSWVACQIFPGRAAFLIVGAAIATAMSANVFFWIIPGQRKVVAAMTSGAPYNAQELAIHGKRGKQRSVHNTYFTLPVVFAMLSNHYGFLYSHDHNWLVLVVMMLAGALIRQFFVQRHQYHHGKASHPWPFAASAVLLIAGLAALAMPEQAKRAIAMPSLDAPMVAQKAPAVDYASVRAVIDARCVQCHNAQMQLKGVRLDTAQSLATHAANVMQQVVVTRQMPMNNSTQMTDSERALIGAWFRAGASVQ